VNLLQDSPLKGRISLHALDPTPRRRSKVNRSIQLMQSEASSSMVSLP